MTALQYCPSSSAFTFTNETNKVILHITTKGELIPGEGLATDEMTKGVFSVLSKAFPEIITGIIRERDEVLVSLNTERELRKSAEDDYRNLCTFLHGEFPPSYHQHVKDKADELRHIIEQKCL